MDPSSLAMLSSATPLFSGQLDSDEMAVTLTQKLGRNVDGRICSTGLTLVLQATISPSISFTVDEAKALVENKSEDHPRFIQLRDELSDVPVLGGGCFGSMQSALTPPSRRLLAECLLPKLLELLPDEPDVPIDVANLSRSLSPLYAVSEKYKRLVDRIMKDAKPNYRATSPLHGHPALLGMYDSAISRGAFTEPLINAQTPRALSPLASHPDLRGVYAAAINRGAFQESSAEAREGKPRSPRATSPLFGHAALTGVYDSALQRGAFKPLKAEAPQIFRIEHESEEDAQPSPRSMSPLRNHPALRGVYASAMDRGAFKQSMAETSDVEGASAETARDLLSPRASSPLLGHPRLAGAYDFAINRGAFRQYTKSPQPSPRASSPLVDHVGLNGVYTSAIKRGAFKQSTAEARQAEYDTREAKAVTPRTPRASSPLRNHPDLNGVYDSAIERGALKRSKADPNSPRATSPLFGHSALTGVYDTAIERGAFKPAKADIPQILRIEHENEESPRPTSPFFDHPVLGGVYASAMKGIKKESEDAQPSPRATSPLVDHPDLDGVYAAAINRGAFKESLADAKGKPINPNSSTSGKKETDTKREVPQIRRIKDENEESPRPTSPFFDHPVLGGVYASAMKGIKKESEDAQPSPRATSPLVDHPDLDGVYAAAINRGAFKESLADAKGKPINPNSPRASGALLGHEEDAQPSPRSMSPLRNHPALRGVYASAMDRGAFKSIASEDIADSDAEDTPRSAEEDADFGNVLHHAADSAAAVLIVQRMLRGFVSRRKLHAQRARDWAVYIGLADSVQSRRHFRWVGRNGTFLALSRRKPDGAYEVCTVDMATGQLSIASDPENNDLNVPRKIVVGDVVDQSGGGLVGAPSTAPDEILVTASGHHTERVIRDDGSILRDFADGWQEQRCSDGTLTIDGAAGVIQVMGDDRTLILHPSHKNASATESHPETIQVDHDDTILVSFPDGTNRQFMPDGSKTTQLPDGTVEQVNDCGTKMTQYPDGTQIQTDPDGTTLVRGTDGSVTKTSQDGTITRKMLNGTRHKVLPDKSEIWHYIDGTRMEVSAPPEKTIRRFAVTGEEVVGINDATVST